VIDGEVVALDSSGRPSFNTLQNFGGSHAALLFFAFDVPILAGCDVQPETLHIRRELLRTKVLSKLDEPIRYSVTLEASLPRLIRSAREQGFEGLVAKQRKSLYEAGKRTGAWQKMRINRGQEFVIGGYNAGSRIFNRNFNPASEESIVEPWFFWSAMPTPRHNKRYPRTMLTIPALTIASRAASK
jgi:ATP-dependent DNA ligase